MSATVVPFRPRRTSGTAPSHRSADQEPGAMRTRYSQRCTPIRIDGSVSLYQLLTGLQSVGLSFRREPGTGVYIISPKQSSQPSR
ncbi:MAG TPA: hypothetical protein VMF64_07770 [Steroidobacteraceae bacterium]|nr:hypothetical protein [Steroidobacteraceae bacterium]